jgi:hypothetical protein
MRSATRRYVVKPLENGLGTIFHLTTFYHQYSSNFFEQVLKPLSGPEGIDYWWIDWQQGETPIAPGVNPTIWVNYVFSSARSWFSPEDR